MPIFSARLNSLLAHKLLSPLPSGTVAPPQKLSRCSTPQAEAARIFFPFSALRAALQTPLTEGMGGKGTDARSSGRGVGAGIRFLPPLRAALSSAANVGFLVRLLLRYRTPAPGTPRPPGKRTGGQPMERLVSPVFK